MNVEQAVIALAETDKLKAIPPASQSDTTQTLAVRELPVPTYTVMCNTLEVGYEVLVDSLVDKKYVNDAF